MAYCDKIRSTFHDQSRSTSTHCWQYAYIHAIQSLFTVYSHRATTVGIYMPWVSIPLPAATFVHEISTKKFAQLYCDFRMDPRDPSPCAYYTVTFIVSRERKRVSKGRFHFTPSRLAGVLAGANMNPLEPLH